MSERLPKTQRLCRGKRIDALFADGRRGGIGPLKFCWLETTGAVGTGTEEGGETGSAGGVGSKGSKGSKDAEAVNVSVLFSVPKKMFKRAWERNLIKRRMRESYRRRSEAFRAEIAVSGRHVDLALICYATEIPDYTTIDGAIAKILGQILACR